MFDPSLLGVSFDRIVLQVVGEDSNQSVGSTSGAGAKSQGVAVTEREQSKRDAMDMRCLSLCIGMLERVNGVRYHHYYPSSNPDTADIPRPSKRIQHSKGS